MQVEMARQQSPGRIQQAGEGSDVKCMQKTEQSFLQKVQKTRNFGQNMDFSGLWRFFWMTSA